MATHEDVIDFVYSLDPEVDKYWTVEGLPRLDIIEKALEDEVSRKLITDLAPNFNRDYARKLKQADSETEESDTALEDNVIENVAETETDPLARGSGDDEARLDTIVAEAAETLEQYREIAEEAKKQVELAAVDLARAIDFKNKVFPPITQAEAIKQFQKSEWEKRAAIKAQLVGSLAISPLDMALRATRRVRSRTSMLDKKPE